MSYGVINKSKKVVAENLVLISEFIAEGNIDQITKKDYATFVGIVAAATDVGVRDGSLKVFGEAYRFKEEDIWNMISGYSAKAKDLLVGRFKTINKEMTKAYGENWFKE